MGSIKPGTPMQDLYVIAPIVNKDTGELMLGAGERIGEKWETIRNSSIKQLEVVADPQCDPLILNTLGEDKTTTYDEALLRSTAACASETRRTSTRPSNSSPRSSTIVNRLPAGPRGPVPPEPQVRHQGGRGRDDPAAAGLHRAGKHWQCVGGTWTPETASTMSPRPPDMAGSGHLRAVNGSSTWTIFW